MERNNSFGNSWADQWDYSNPDPFTTESTKSSKNNKGSKARDMVSGGLDKTKAVASTGLKKVKEGTCLGFHWIKDKYNKRTQKH
ncbi:hypothetical protein QJS10_CPA05g01884 [Acorus calamus]|uniref:Uncharacterized protein n=1 Tax=Acorus calamus TaxID=4465 RepID=A0AAV9EXJ6_ACOCL|nr:hypothetical protein QJS10_CPA05g01884 [Acorus calamus]